jgi:hypothetical protein
MDVKAGMTTGFATAFGGVLGALTGFAVTSLVDIDRQDRPAVVEGAAIAGGLIGAFWGGVVIAALAAPPAQAATTTPAITSAAK